MSNADFHPEESDLRRELQGALQASRAAVGPCPAPERLMAARSGVPFEGADSILRHAAACPFCQQLVADLSDYPFPGASEDEDRRIRAAWQQDGRPAWWMGRGAPFAVAAVLVIAVAASVLVHGFHTSSMPPETSVRLPAPAPESPLPLAKAPVRIPAVAVLTFRGAGEAASAYLPDLAAALRPYQKDDYAGAVRQLESVCQKYPAAPEARFYLGVSQLFLNQNGPAADTLRAARIHAGEDLQDDIAWYLAVALDRSGSRSGAETELQNLCLRPGTYQQKACTAAEQKRR